MKILSTILFLLLVTSNTHSQITQLIRNPSMDGPTGDNKTAPFWGIISGTPDCCSSDTISCKKISYKIPISSPDGGNWARFFFAEISGEPYLEKIGAGLKYHILEGKEYQLSYHGAFSPISLGTEPSSASILVSFSGYKDTLHMNAINTWYSDTITFTGSGNSQVSFEKLEQDYAAACYVDGVSLTCLGIDTVSFSHDTTLCSNAAILFHPNYLDYIMSNSHPSIIWEDGDTIPYHIIDSSGTYFVKTDVGCRLQVDTFNIQIYPEIPTLPIGIDTTLCFGDTIILNSSIPRPNATYLWSTGSEDTEIIVTEPGIYNVHITDSVCHKFTSSTIKYMETLSPLITEDTFKCIQLPMLLTVYSPIETKYLWNTGDTSATLNVNEYGAYSVIATNRCDSYYDTTLFIQPIEYNLDLDTTLCFGDTLFLEAPASPDLVWEQYSNQISTYSNQTNLPITESGWIYLNFGCPNLPNNGGEAHVTFLSCEEACDVFIPNIFSPNYDFYNDLFKVEFPCPPSTYSISIYDRWGNNVFKSTSYDKGWDGNFRGKQLPPAVYVYRLEYQIDGYNPKTTFGDVTLIR